MGEVTAALAVPRTKELHAVSLSSGNEGTHGELISNNRFGTAARALLAAGMEAGGCGFGSANPECMVSEVGPGEDSGRADGDHGGRVVCMG